MKTFEYDAVDQSGTSYHGYIEASSGEEAILKLVQQNRYPKSVQELTATQIHTIKQLTRLKNLRNTLEQKQEPNIKEAKHITIDWVVTATIAVMIIVVVLALIRLR